MRRSYITASELAEYIYCECCWMDNLEGKRVRTIAMEQGTKYHDAIQGKFLMLQMLKRTAIVLVLISLVILGLVMILKFGLDIRL